MYIFKGTKIAKILHPENLSLVHFSYSEWKQQLSLKDWQNLNIQSGN